MSEFIEKIKQIPDLMHGKGCTAEQLADAQQILNMSFPAEYIEYVREFGYILFDGTEWTGIGMYPNDHAVTGEDSTVGRTLLEREINPEFPDKMFVLEAIGIDCKIVAVDESGVVYYVANDYCEKAFDSISDYLDECIRHMNDSGEE